MASSDATEAPSRDEPIAEAFGQRLRELRHERGLSQERLAELAGVHATFVSNIERGYSAPTLYTLLKLATALEVTPGQLVDGLQRPASTRRSRT